MKYSVVFDGKYRYQKSASPFSRIKEVRSYFRMTVLLDFFHRPVFKELENTTFRRVDVSVLRCEGKARTRLCPLVRANPKHWTTPIKVIVTLRLAVYRQSVRLGVKPLDTHDQIFFNCTPALIDLL
jgi:hypothetical protein